MYVPQKTTNKTTVWTTIPFLGLYPKEWKSICQRDICTLMLIAALLKISGICNQS